MCNHVAAIYDLRKFIFNKSVCLWFRPFPIELRSNSYKYIVKSYIGKHSLYVLGIWVSSGIREYPRINCFGDYFFTNFLNVSYTIDFRRRLLVSRPSHRTIKRVKNATNSYLVGQLMKLKFQVEITQL